MTNYYKTLFLDYLNQETKHPGKPHDLYAPITYLLKLGGKRLRPVLTLMATEAFSGSLEESLPVAMSVEVFHNFTLMHDDIIDHSDKRRGQPTVHKKWNIDTAILSGDAMMICAYRYLERAPGKHFFELTKLLSDTALQVCEGQQLDIEFEKRQNVSYDDYLKMISQKTATLIAAAIKMGAVVAGANDNEQKTIYRFGHNMGIAFQLQDDYLDTFGEEKTFGKTIGMDILEHKKTALYIKALENLPCEEAIQLRRYFHEEEMTITPEQKITEVKNLFVKAKIPKILTEEVKHYTHCALKILEDTTMSKISKQNFRSLITTLIKRDV